MREFETRIVDHLANGLRPSPRLGVNVPYLQDCMNMKPTVEGLVPYEKVQTPFAAGPAIDFPFPQLFKGKGVTLLANKTTIFTVTEGAPWTVSGDILTVGAIVAGGPWHFLDLFDSWLLFNGSSTVYCSNIHELEGGAAAIVGTAAPLVQTGCYLNGRAFMGGFVAGGAVAGSIFNHASWTALVTSWNADLPGSMVDIVPDIGQNFVMWSSIGGGDALWIFRPAWSTTIRTAGPRIFEHLKKNELGWMPMPWQGKVLAMKPLGNAVIVYGEDGISALIQTLEPIPTFGLKHLLDIGVVGRGAVGGTSREHVFIDGANYLWKIGTDLVPKRLNYQEFFTSMTAAKIVVSHDQEDDEYYISDGIYSRILTSKGLGIMNQVITSIVVAEGALLGVEKDSQQNVSSCINGTQAYDTFDGASATGFHVLKTTTGAGIAQCGSADEIALVDGKEILVSFDLVLDDLGGRDTLPTVDLALNVNVVTSRSDEGATAAVEGSNYMIFTANVSTTGSVNFKCKSAGTTEFTVSNLVIAIPNCVRTYATTDAIDFGLRAIKTLVAVEVGLSSPSNCWVIVEYRHSTSDSFTTLAAVPVNAEGVAYVNVSAVEFRITVRAATFSSSEPKISYMNLRWKLSDKRQIRGVYVTPTPS